MLDMPLTQSDADLGLRKEVFVINDIALLVPPTAISVQKEDLTFTWRTLRTRSSTKVPTGHGRHPRQSMPVARIRGVTSNGYSPLDRHAVLIHAQGASGLCARREHPQSPHCRRR